MLLEEKYYKDKFGYYPFEEDTFLNKTRETIDYLKENNIDDGTILKVIEESPNENYLSPESLPAWLWDKSLLEKDVFYYHNKLHIKSKAPIWNPESGEVVSVSNYVEMIINFTIDNLLDYFYERMMIPIDLIERKKDAGAMNYLLKKYDKFDFISSVDFVLFLIDLSRRNQQYVDDVFELKKNEREAYDFLKGMVEQAKFEKANKIVWRNES